MKARRVPVKLGGRPCEVAALADDGLVPIVTDAVNERLKRIESAASRIDTVGFALEAAFSFAAEVEELKAQMAQMEARHDRERQSEAQAMMEALEQVTTRLERIVERESQDNA